MHIPKTLADWMPGRPFVEPPLPRWALHSTWAEVEDLDRWKGLLEEYGDWACRRACSFAPSGNWDILEASAKNLYRTRLARI